MQEFCTNGILIIVICQNSGSEITVTVGLVAKLNLTF